MPEEKDYFNDLLGTGPLNTTSAAFMESTSKFKWWSGNRGGQKTTTLVALVNYLAVAIPNNRILLGRKYREELYTSTFQTWRDWIKPERFGIDYRGGKNPKVAVYPNGSEVWFVGFDRDARWLGNEIGAFAIDQAEQLEQSKFATLATNLRWRHTPEHCMFGLCVANPRGHNWAYKLFHDRKGVAPDKLGQYGFFKNPPKENVRHLKGGDAYYDDLYPLYPPHMRARMLEGSDDAVEGLALADFIDTEAGNIMDFKPDPWWQPIMAYDHGFYPSPACFLLGWYDEKTDEGYIEHEVSAMQHSVDELLDLLKEKAGEINYPWEKAKKICDWQVRAQKDSVGKPVYEDFCDRGFVMENAPTKRINYTLQRLNGRLLPQKRTGRSGLFVHPRCTGLREAAGDVVVEDREGDLSGEGVDYVDALRYWVLGIVPGSSPQIRPDVRGTWEEVEKYNTYTAIERPPAEFKPPAWYPGWVDEGRQSG